MKHSFLVEPFSPFRQRQLYKTAFTAVMSVCLYLRWRLRDPLKKPQKTRKISFCGWVLCINGLYPTTTSTTKTKTNTPKVHRTLVSSRFQEVFLKIFGYFYKVRYSLMFLFFKIVIELNQVYFLVFKISLICFFLLI